MFCVNSKRGAAPQFCLLRSRRSRGSLWSHGVHVMVMMMVVVVMMMVHHRHRLGGHRRRPGRGAGNCRLRERVSAEAER
jgi:hypothetical protein